MDQTTTAPGRLVNWREVARRSGAGDNPRDQTPGFIYFAVAPCFLKIGWSKDPRRRVKQIRSPGGDTPHLIGAIRGNRQEETALLALLKDDRAFGEWTRTTDALLVEVFALIRQEGVSVL
jgi:hypothetical protein